ncbi:hypothetical protein [Egicoccus sp. AB-alg2]|uniref:hypothetical protein n=1 Tax=Egicoccus sp. AB-alg2 TaxID=3242693 RepID=UPI00359D4F19
MFDRAFSGSSRGIRLLGRLTVVAAVGTVAIVVATGTDGVGTTIEILVVLGLLAVSLLLASPPRRRTWQLAGADRAMAAVTTAAIDALDRVEHRRVDLGAPFPQMVVGPTGVSIVDVCPIRGDVHVTRDGVQEIGAGTTCRRCDAAARAAEAARRALHEVEGGPDVPVRVLAVVPPGTRVSRDAGLADAIDAVPADRLSDRLARGPVLPMALVDRSFTRLAALSGTQVTPA